MKKIILAPAVAIVAGSVAFAGPAAIATPEATPASATDKPEAPKPELSAPNDGKDALRFRKEGQTIEYKNLEAGKNYTWSFIGADGVQSSGTFTANKANGSFDAVVTNDTDYMYLPGKYTVTVKDENGETAGKTSFKVERHEDDPGDGGNPDASKPEFSVENKKKQATDFRDNGQTVNFKNLESGKKYSWTLTSDHNIEHPGSFTAKDSDGNFTVTPPNQDGAADALIANYTVTVKDENGETVGTATFSVIGDDENPGDENPDDGDNPDAPKPEISVKHDKVRATPFRDNGHAVEYKNLEPGKKYTWSIHGGEEISSTGTFTAKEANGTFFVEVPSDTDESALPGEYTVKLEDENGTTLDSVTKFTVVKDSEDSGNPDEHEVRYQLKLDRHELTAKEFLDKESGVQIGVIGLKSNEKFTYSVTKVDGEGKVEDYENEATADEHGRWGTTLNGVQRGQSIESFVGKYKVTIKSEQGELTDHFTVTNGKKSDNDDDAEAGDNGSGSGSDNGSGSGNDSSAGNSSDLPRTGAGLTGLLAGGALLTVGAATVLITRRRTK